jgi:hypothetical protein
LDAPSKVLLKLIHPRQILTNMAPVLAALAQLA